MSKRNLLTLAYLGGGIVETFELPVYPRLHEIIGQECNHVGFIGIERVGVNQRTPLGQEAGRLQLVQVILDDLLHVGDVVRVAQRLARGLPGARHQGAVAVVAQQLAIIVLGAARACSKSQCCT